MLVRGGATRATSLLGRRKGDIAVFDTGMGHHEGPLVAALAQHGVKPEDVTLVFNTHSHVDHSHNNSIFHQARIFCSARDREWTRAVHDVLERVAQPGPEDIAPFYPEIAAGAFDRKIVRKVLGLEKLLWDVTRWGRPDRVAWLEEASLPSGITAFATPGHSPYHMSFIIQTAGRPVLVCGDALLLRGEETAPDPLMPPWSTPAYRRSQQLICAFDGIIAPGHDEPYDNIRT